MQRSEAWQMDINVDKEKEMYFDHKSIKNESAVFGKPLLEAQQEKDLQVKTRVCNV